MPRAPRPDDLYRFRIATEPRLSPDGRRAVLTLQTVAPGFDGYRHALWLIETDGSVPPRQLTLGARHDRHPRVSSDGRTLAFISDRRSLIEEEPGTRGPGRDPRTKDDREDSKQVHLLPLDGGEARRLIDLPRGVDAFEWSPDGSRLVLVSSSRGAAGAEDDRRRGIDRKADAGSPPPSDYRFIDRLEYMLNGSGFTYDKIGHLWLVDAATGVASRLTDGQVADGAPAWSPDGRKIAFTSHRRRHADLLSTRLDLHVVDVETRKVTAVTRGPRSMFFAPTWLPDGSAIAALGHRITGGAGSRNDIWFFAPDGSDATPSGGRNLSAEHDLMPGAGMASDVTPGEGATLSPSKDGDWIHFSAPIQGAYELWRIATGDIAGGDWPQLKFETTPWEDPAYYREISPIAYADEIRTPLLIQHSERDLRTTIAQAEALFTVLRSLRRPVRLLRVPEETHELTRSGTPFRRIGNLRIVEGWFRHFLIDCKCGMPPLPKVRGGQ